MKAAFLSEASSERGCPKRRWIRNMRQAFVLICHDPGNYCMFDGVLLVCYGKDEQEHLNVVLNFLL